MPITAAYLLNKFRREMEDPAYPDAAGDEDGSSLWSDEDINDYMDQAQEEFCRKIDCIPDTSSFVLRLKAVQEYADIESVITQIRGGYVQGTKRFIPAVTMSDMQRGYNMNDYGNVFAGDWRQTIGDVRYMVTDDTIGQVRLTPIPAADTVIELSVYRLPETRISDGGELEVPDMFRRRLLLKMRSLGYFKGDAETFNQRQAENFERLWVQYLSQAERDVKRYQGGAHTTTYGGV